MDGFAHETVLLHETVAAVAPHARPARATTGMEHVSPYDVLLGPRATDHVSKSK